MATAPTTADLATALGKQLAAATLELPVLPGIATEVMSLSQLDTTDAAKLSAVMHRDQALASNVLRVANSAAHAGQLPCSSLQQAVTRLGMQNITEIAVAVALRSRVFAPGGGCAYLFAEVWKHSLLAGFFTKEIARLRRRNVEIAFLCGLLHDVGKAVLLAAVERMPDLDGVRLDVVAAAVHEHHTAAGALLAQQWRLPDQVAECVAHHHDHGKAPNFQEMAATVALADLLAHELRPSKRVPAIGRAALERHPLLVALNLYPDQLAGLLARSDQALRFVEEMK